MFEHFFDVLATKAGLTSFGILAVLEIVLGIDNIVFLTIVVGRAPENKQRFVRNMGLVMAMFLRIGMLFGITYLVNAQEITLLTFFSNELSIKDVILLIGGLFLIGKSTMEIHHKIFEAKFGVKKTKKKSSKAAKLGNSLGSLFVQIGIINIIFSIDSILTAIGLTKDVPTMVLAVVVSTLFMMLFAGRVGRFINENPTIIMLALSFLIMIGTLLIADSFHYEIPRGYVYFAMGFSLFVEVLNLVLLKRLYKPPSEENNE